MVLCFGKSSALNILALSACLSTAAVVVQDNGYQNIFVTFSPDISEREEQRNVLQKAKDLMTQTSAVVQKATGMHFGEIIFLLPYTWGSLDQWSEFEASYSSAKVVYHEADIFVEYSSDTLYGTQPFTLQSSGCGTEGVRITVPKDFLKSDTDITKKARTIAREWIRYRFGVFYENGFPNDELYPLYFRKLGSDDSSDIRITDCSNAPLKYSFKNSLGNECSLTVDESGMPAGGSTCSISLDSENNSDVVSSLMYAQDLPSVVYLCDEENHFHNAHAPSKQNSLCKGSSIWSIMKKHPDFTGRRTSGSNDLFPSPRFKIQLDDVPKFVVAVDRSKFIAGEAPNVIKSAIQAFLFDLPDEAAFSILRFSSEVERGEVEDRILGGLPFLGNDPSCPDCAVKEALQDFTGKNRGAIVIFSSVDWTTENPPELANQLKSSEICLFVIFLDVSNSSTEGFQELMNSSPCSNLWTVPKIEQQNALIVLRQLIETLENIKKRYTYHNAYITMETKEVLRTSSVPIKVDRSTKDFEIRLINTLNIGDFFEAQKVVLKNSKGESLTYKKPQPTSGVYRYNFSNDEVGNFEFQIQEIRDHAFPVLLQVVAKESNSESIRVRTWVKDTTTDDADASVQKPVILYAEVTMGINPILGGNVEAIVSRPSEGDFKVILTDNGFGDPDVTKNDGIYSHYFTQFTKEGDYVVTVTVNDEGQSQTAQPPQSGPFVPCCGSIVPTGVKKDTGPFSRVAYANFHAVSGRPADGYKPSTVRDLRVISIDDERIVKLQWTAPGNEMDSGTTQRYILRMFETKEDAMGNFEQDKFRNSFETMEPAIPVSYGNKQTMKIQINDSMETNNYYFAMRSVNTQGKQSDTSNAVEIFLAALTSSTPSPTPKLDNTTEDGRRIGSAGMTDGTLIGIIVGVCVLVIVICICAYVAFYILVVRPRRRKDEDHTSERVPQREEDEEVTENKQDGNVPAVEWHKGNDSISPVNSWPSNVLVNHHKKVQEAKRKNERPPIFKEENLENPPNEIKTISNGLLPNPIYSSYSEDLNESHDHDNVIPDVLPQHMQDQATIQSNRRVTHV